VLRQRSSQLQKYKVVHENSGVKHIQRHDRAFHNCRNVRKFETCYTTQELRGSVKYTRKLSFFIMWLLYAQLLGGMGQLGAAVSAMDVSAMKCEMCFPLECHQSAKVRTVIVKRVGARFGLALVPIVQQ